VVAQAGLLREAQRRRGVSCKGFISLTAQWEVIAVELGGALVQDVPPAMVGTALSKIAKGSIFYIFNR
jgi:hypothetical protein